MTSSFFRLVVIFRSFGTPYWYRCPFKTEAIGGAETAVNNYQSTLVTSKKSENLIQTPAEVGDYARKRVAYIIMQT